MAERATLPPADASPAVVAVAMAMVRTYRQAAIRCAASHGRSPYRDACCDRAGLADVVPLIRAQVAAERRCVLCNPGTPEEIRQREEASAELDRLIVDDDEPVADVQVEPVEPCGCECCKEPR